MRQLFKSKEMSLIQVLDRRHRYCLSYDCKPINLNTTWKPPKTRRYVKPFVVFLKAKTCLRISWIKKIIMVQICYLMLYLGIETVSCRLLLKNGYTWIETRKSWATFSSFNAMPSKITKTIIMVSTRWWNLFAILYITLQEQFVYGSRHNDFSIELTKNGNIHVT